MIAMWEYAEMGAVGVRTEVADARATADAVLALSVVAGLAPGSKLPTERSLSQDLGLSRHALRQGLSLLEQRGLISRQVGRGTFLGAADVVAAQGEQPGPERPSRLPAGPLSRRGRRGMAGRAVELTDVGPADVMAARHVLEPNAMAFVVARATSNDFQWMHDCLVGGDAARTYEEFEYWDLALHRAIIEASRNPLLIRLYKAIEDARHSPIWGDLKRHNSTAERREDYRCDHHSIIEALSARDSVRASEAMQTHLTRIDSHLFGTPA
jgi:GntR family transcriptional regulator, uxu operon transcriptional repressor